MKTSSPKQKNSLSFAELATLPPEQQAQYTELCWPSTLALEQIERVRERVRWADFTG